MKEIRPITWLSEWYKDQCNEDWEHTYGIKIYTIDNPGWALEIDMEETEYERLVCVPIQTENAMDDWIRYEISNNTFLGYCSPNNLDALINAFKDIVDSCDNG